MESARVVFFDRKKFYGFAKVVTFTQGEINGILIWPEEILFHLGRGYKMKEGKEKPKFNYKQKLKKIPQVGECLVFVRKKSENKNLRDKASVWGLRTQYKEKWKIIDRTKRQQKQRQKLEQVFHFIKTENFQETRKE